MRRSSGVPRFSASPRDSATSGLPAAKCRPWNTTSFGKDSITRSGAPSRTRLNTTQSAWRSSFSASAPPRVSGSQAPTCTGSALTGESSAKVALSAATWRRNRPWPSTMAASVRCGSPFLVFRFQASTRSPGLMSSGASVSCTWASSLTLSTS